MAKIKLVNESPLKLHPERALAGPVGLQTVAIAGDSVSCPDF
jgi:hypothetical protein